MTDDGGAHDGQAGDGTFAYRSELIRVRGTGEVFSARDLAFWGRIGDPVA